MTEQQACTLCGAGGHTAAQCNWNQGTSNFQREERYVVAKISKMHPHPTFRRRHLESLKRELSGVLVDCVVVERDWPEYETVWRMIEARVTGQAGSMVECPHRCGSMFAKESYGAGFIEGSGMCPACDAAMPAKDIVSPGEEPTPPELLAAKLIDTWRTVHGRPVPWEKAVEITAIATSMSNEERERLLAMGDAPVAQAGQLPQGWKLVPIEPTKEMMLNGSSCQHHGHDDLTCVQRQTRRGIWSKMLDAAPAQGGA